MSDALRSSIDACLVLAVDATSERPVPPPHDPLRTTIDEIVKEPDGGAHSDHLATARSLRDVLTRVGGVDLCVTEFIRVNDSLLPEHVFRRFAPELAHGAKTPAGTEMRVQLLGSNPEMRAANAVRACTLGAPVLLLVWLASRVQARPGV